MLPYPRTCLHAIFALLLAIICPCPNILVFNTFPFLMFTEMDSTEEDSTNAIAQAWRLPADDEPLSNEMVRNIENGIAPAQEAEAGVPAATRGQQPLVYMVMGQKQLNASSRTRIQPKRKKARSRHRDARSTWQYWGRPFNGGVGSSIALDTRWLNANHMRHTWRESTVLKHENRWFRVPVLSCDTQTPIPTAPRKRLPPLPPKKLHPPCKRRRKRLLDRRGKRLLSRRRYRRLKKAPPSAPIRPPTGTPKCIQSALLKFSSYVGFASNERKMQKMLCGNYDMRKVCQAFRWAGNFMENTKITLGSNDEIFDLPPLFLYLVQLSGKDSHGNKDNLHCVAIFNNLIFDMNHLHPLALNRDNLNACILGGHDWVFEKASRIIRFVFAEGAKKWAIKYSSNKSRIT